MQDSKNIDAGGNAEPTMVTVKVRLQVNNAYELVGAAVAKALDMGLDRAAKRFDHDKLGECARLLLEPGDPPPGCSHFDQWGEEVSIVPDEMFQLLRAERDALGALHDYVDDMLGSGRLAQEDADKLNELLLASAEAGNRVDAAGGYEALEAALAADKPLHYD